MEKRQAQDYIKDVLNQPFDQERFELFIRNLLNNIESRDNSYSGNLIPEAFRDHIAHYRRIGKYTDPEGEQLDILIIQTRSVKKLERTRTALRNFVVRHLKTFEKQYALAAFYSKEDDGVEWRFSLVKIDYETKKSEKGKIKVEEELVPAKRFSFLVGKYENAHTAQKQLLPLLTNDHSNPLIVKEKDGDGSVEGAFSIQKVTVEFYEQYKELYLKIAENQSLAIALKKEGLDTERFVKKLLGQIVFLYFIQKKGWLGVPEEKKMGEGSKRFLQDRFDMAEQNGKNYYNDFLRYLFYEALAKEHNDKGVKYYYENLGCRIPFLNGGLFEAEFDWRNTDFTIPNNLFRNNEKNKAGDKGTGVLDVFDRYNFTIKEDEPLEKEVAVDPEMLGKVFENMLEIKERKSKGAYYTPREIVHYMCQESLIHYLDNTVNDYKESYQQLGNNQTSLVGGSGDKKGNLNLELENKGDICVPKKDLEKFIRKGHLILENEEIAQEAKKRIEEGEIKSTKHKQILPNSISAFAVQLDGALKDIKICDPAIGSGAFPVGLLHEIVTARLVLNSFLQCDDSTPYNLKRHAIQESIYGVDIDASAIDIARLRLWLSMIVDEEDYDTIDALPNLDYKIVCGNSLIGLPGQGADRFPQLCDELEMLKDKFFKETDENKKKDLRYEIDNKINQVLKAAKDFEGYDIDFDFKLYFSEVWRQNNGFDILIGNPPYKIEYNLDLKKIYEKLYSAFKRNNDVYIAFFQQGLRQLKHNGSLIFITPNTYLNGDYFKEFRKLVSTEYALKEVVDFKNYSVFNDPTVFVSITHIVKNKYEKYSMYKEYLSGFNDVIESKIEIKKGSSQSFIPKNPIYKLIQSKSKVTFNDVFLIKDVGFNYWTKGGGKNRKGNSIGKRVFINEQLHENDIPYIKGRDIKKYFVERGTQYLRHDYEDYLDPDIDTFRFSENILRTSPKICYRQTSDSIVAGIDYESQLCNKTVHVIINKKGGKVDLTYTIALLNSELFDFLYKELAQEKPGRAFSQVKTTYIKKLPFIYKYDNNISTLVEYLIFLSKLKKNDMIFSYLCNLVDGIVYEIYLSDSVEKNNKFILENLGSLNRIISEESVEKNFSIIQNEFNRLYNPNHPVRNNLETLDSIEEVRAIKEALK